jgi:hypothetical protein
MEDVRDRRRNFAGALLILIGAIWLLAESAPELLPRIGPAQWAPVILLGIGAYLAFTAVVEHKRGPATGAAILMGIGAVLFWQNLTGGWINWSWAWALIPGFVGVGIVFGDLVEGHPGARSGEALRLLGVSAVLTLVFGTLFGAPLIGHLGPYWPVVVILFGVLLLFRR